MKKSDSKEAIFGMSGYSPGFFASPLGKKRENLFKWTKEFGIDAVEYNCTYGVKMNEEQAILYKRLAEENDIYLSIHAAYYINLASQKPQTVELSKNEIRKSFKLAETLGVERIIFHPGGGYGTDREAGIQRIIDILNELEKELNTKDIKIYPEIGGKINSLGTLDEIIRICKNVKYARPCIDFAHLHARELGSMNSPEKFVEVMKKIEKELGRDILEETHFHVYPVDYTKAGEKVHKVFGEKKEVSDQVSLFDEESEEYMPRAEDYIKALKIMNLKPITICEAHNTQDIGAKLLKEIYYNNI